MPTVEYTVYKTVVNANYRRRGSWASCRLVYEGRSQEDAIRAWDAESVHRADLTGGIMVQSFDKNDNMIRDGWILHINESGHVYLNPRI